MGAVQEGFEILLDTGSDSRALCQGPGVRKMGRVCVRQLGELSWTEEGCVEFRLNLAGEVFGGVLLPQRWL